MRNGHLKSYAKINLALHVTGKKKLLHKIESIVSFVKLHDLIFIQKNKLQKIIKFHLMENFLKILKKKYSSEVTRNS